MHLLLLLLWLFKEYWGSKKTEERYCYTCTCTCTVYNDGSYRLCEGATRAWLGWGNTFATVDDPNESIIHKVHEALLTTHCEEREALHQVSQVFYWGRVWCINSLIHVCCHSVLQE